MKRTIYEIDKRIKLSLVFKGLKPTGEISLLYKNYNRRKKLTNSDNMFQGYSGMGSGNFYFGGSGNISWRREKFEINMKGFRRI